MKDMHQKYESLLALLRELGGAAVAYSGGTDSTLLLHAAREALGARALAVTAAIRSVPARELREAAEWCIKTGVEQVTVRLDELEIEGFRENPPNRCYLCKRALFGEICKIARARGLAVVEGSNVDDAGDYRPGIRALRELGVRSPLREAGLTKAEIRALSREFGLPTWDKPSAACLASRFAYGETITAERLAMVEAAEEKLRALGFRQLRVRVHGELARIELPPEDIMRMMAPDVRGEAEAHLRALGFAYVTLDLRGFRSGSMNEVLKRG